MRLYLFIIPAFLLGCATTQNSDLVTYRYDWSEDPDYSALRNDMGWSDDFSDRCEFDRPLGDMVAKLESELWDDAASIGLTWLNQCPVDMRAHYYTGIALAESGKEADSENHFRWLEGLLHSLVSSGDGETPETAYVTISIAEEHDALYFFGLEIKSQALISGPVMCDLITATNDDGEEVLLYFRPDAHFSRLSKLLD